MWELVKLEERETDRGKRMDLDWTTAGAKQKGLETLRFPSPASAFMGT